jgi:outer membrane protein OmpA-like peptidoglycan-associated protein
MRISYLCAVAALVWARHSVANVVGGDLQNFNAVPGGIDYVTVHASETVEPGIFNLGLMVNHAVNSLPYSDEAAQGKLDYNDALTMLDVGLGAGVLPSLELGFSVQSLLAQQVSGGSDHGQFGSRGIINSRVYGKLRALELSRGGLAVVTSAVFNNVRNNPYIGAGGSQIGIVELAGDTHFSKVGLAVNVGYRFRKKGDPLPGYETRPMGNQYIGSIGASYLLPMVDTKLVLEIFGSRSAERGSTGLSKRQASSAELLAGVKHDLTTAIALHAGGGTELIHGAASPDWRAYAGLNWAFGTPRRPDRAGRMLVKVTTREESATLHRLNFATGSHQVPGEAMPELQALAREIKAASYELIIVEGHTDSVGSEEDNQQLSERRAKTVRTWLIKHAGVAAGKIKAVGYGESRPIADNGNFQGRHRNRRVEVRVQR